MFSKGIGYITWDYITNRVSELDILTLYFDFSHLPCVVCSPFRKDKKPSFEVYTKDDKVLFFDFATRESYSIISFLCKFWNLSYSDVLQKIGNDISKISKTDRVKFQKKGESLKKKDFVLKVKTRDWFQYDIQYWNMFGIPINWVKHADVHPISFQIYEYEDHRSVFRCDKFAYAFHEYKDGLDLIKIYQPFNKNGWKWISSFRGGIISLWDKLPQKGKIVCVCSSLKDALCLWANTGIPSIAPQGEGYSLSEDIVNELKQRFEYQFIFFDNDEPGLRFSKNLSEKTGFKNIILPSKYGCKDISDLMALFMPDKEKFKNVIIPLFKKLL